MDGITEIVNDTGCRHSVTAEQLPAFLEAGWTIIQPAEPEKEPKKKKTSK